MFNRVRLWLRSALLRRRLEREMQEEMSGHLERSTARLVARGLSADEARRAALREFGNVAWLQEKARDARGTVWLDALVADCRFAAAHFARKPGVTIVMLVVLAAGMSISTLLFSWVHSYAVQPPMGIALEEDLVRIRGSRTAGADGRGTRPFAEAEFLEYLKLTDQFAAVAGWVNSRAVLAVGGDAARGMEARVTFVTANYFAVLGVQPLLGAGLPAVEEPASAPVAVIGHAAWDRLFARNPDVIGSVVHLNGVAVTIVGVAPPRFSGVLMGSGDVELWLPLAALQLLLREMPANFRAVARLRPGVRPSAASGAVRVVVERMAADNHELRDVEPSTDVVPLLSENGDPMFERDVRLMSFWIGLLALLVLLVSCTNVSALLTGLAAARRQEIAIRLSLGAARTRILRQLLTESVWLASVAAVAALGIVWIVLRAATHFFPALPFEIGITWPSSMFTFGLALAVGILFGLSPALHATRLGLASVLRDSGGAIAAKRARLQRGLVVAQIAFTQPLIVMLAAVLLVVIRDLQPRSPTEFADRLIVVWPQLRFPAGTSDATASETMQQMRNSMRRLQDRLQGTPGVEAAVLTWSSNAPLGFFAVHPDDRAGGTPQLALQLSGQRSANGYFGAMGIPVVRGRDFTPTEVSREGGTGEVAVIVGTDLARRLWGGSDPLGRRLQATTDTVVGAPRTLVVVGVVDDPMVETRTRGEPDRIYLPPDTTHGFPGLLLRTGGPAQVLLPTVRKAMQEEIPDAVASIRTLAAIQEEHTRNFRIATGGLSAAGLLALLLSAVGLYAVVAFSVAQRTGEIAVRIAVGARGRQIVQRFVGDGLRLSAFGLAFGLPISLIGLRLLMTIPDIPAVALPRVTAIVAIGVFSIAIAAVWIPARRAAAVDPAVILRRE
jgi:predicted permease